MSFSVKVSLILSFIVLLSALSYKLYEGKKLPSVKHKEAQLLSDKQIFESERIKYKQDGVSNKKKSFLQESGETSDAKNKKQKLELKEVAREAAPRETNQDKKDKVKSLVNELRLIGSIKDSDISSEGVSYDFDTLRYSFDTENIEDTFSDDKHKKEKEFLNSVALVLISYQYKDLKPSLKAFDKFFKGQASESEIKILKSRIQDHRKTAEEISKIEVPESAKYIKDALVSSYNELADKLNTLINNKVSIENILNYNKASQRVASTLIMISNYIKLNNIEIDGSDPASIFVFPMN